MGMPAPYRPFVATVASLGVHLGLGLLGVLWAGTIPPLPPPPLADHWSGSAVEVDAIGPEDGSGAEQSEAAESTALAGEPQPELKPEPPAPASPEPVVDNEPLEERPARVRPKAPPSKAPVADRDNSKPEPRELSPVEAALARGQATFHGDRGSDPEEGERSPTVQAGPASFGAQGLAPGVRHLPKAFARALPPAGWRDGGWRELPLGEVGELVIDLVVDDQGKLSELVYVDPQASRRQPAPLRRMVERCVLMLKAGTFSLAPSAQESGKQRLKVEARLMQVDAASEAWSFQAPASGQPGRGVFVLTSGLRMEARISLVR